MPLEGISALRGQLDTQEDEAQAELGRRNPPFSTSKAARTWKTLLAGTSSRVLLNCTWHSTRASGRRTAAMASAWLGVQDPNKPKRGKRLGHEREF